MNNHCLVENTSRENSDVMTLSCVECGLCQPEDVILRICLTAATTRALHPELPF